MAQAEVMDYRAGSTLGAPGGGAEHANRLFLACFFSIFATSSAFIVRAMVITEWGTTFNLSEAQKGAIFPGAALFPFAISIVLFSLFIDRLGYGKTMGFAVFAHLVGTVVTILASKAGSTTAAYQMLYFGTLITSLANGAVEAVANPVTATLFPRNKTHYLNILHAGWPLGLVIGGLGNFFFAGKVRWEFLLALYALPTLYYGAVVFMNRFPISEAKAAGLTVGQMVSHVFAPLLLFLFLIHAMIGYVELGTDGWVQNILNPIIGSKAFLLFVYTSLLMFVLRFFAGPIVHKINPLGLLFISAIFGAVGLYWLGAITPAGVAVASATLFALGKTFYWPTMLGVIGKRFPKTGAIAMGL